MSVLRFRVCLVTPRTVSVSLTNTLLVLPLHMVDISKHVFNIQMRGFPGGLVVRMLSFHCRRHLDPLAGELRSHILRGMAKKKKKKNTHKYMNEQAIEHIWAKEGEALL